MLPDTSSITIKRIACGVLSKSVIGCGLPSSRISKSFCASVVTSRPSRSVTVTKTRTASLRPRKIGLRAAATSPASTQTMRVAHATNRVIVNGTSSEAHANSGAQFMGAQRFAQTKNVLNHLIREQLLVSIAKVQNHGTTSKQDATTNARDRH